MAPFKILLFCKYKEKLTYLCWCLIFPIPKSLFYSKPYEEKKCGDGRLGEWKGSFLGENQ